MSKEAIGVIPPGSMNFALAKRAFENGHPITFCFHTEDSLRYFEDTREIKQMPGKKFPDSPDVIATTDVEALKDKKIIFFTPRSWDLRATLVRAMPYMGSDQLLVFGTKGFDEYRGKFYTPSQVIEQIIPNAHNRFAIISGPNFADQIFEGVITATVVVAHKRQTAQTVKGIFGSDNNGNGKDFLIDIYRGHPEDVEIVGAFKNVVGLVMGFARTLENYGENTGASILYEGLQEAAILCRQMRRSSRAVMQLCGIGDYGLLMNSESSRNVKAGYMFGTGEWDIDYLMDPKHTIEGIRTVKAVRFLAGRRIRLMPLAFYAYEILYGGMNPQLAVRDLLAGKLPKI